MCSFAIRKENFHFYLIGKYITISVDVCLIVLFSIFPSIQSNCICNPVLHITVNAAMCIAREETVKSYFILLKHIIRWWWLKLITCIVSIQRRVPILYILRQDLFYLLNAFCYYEYRMFLENICYDQIVERTVPRNGNFPTVPRNGKGDWPFQGMV